ncbi:MAG TPA: hypothetical protein VIY98_03305, partial [Nitrososphaeraceae archaeon]
PISNIIKACERKKELQAKREKSNQASQPKKPSISSQAFILFKEGKQIDEVKVLLDIPFKFAIKYWVQYLKSTRMYECFEFYQDHSYDIPTFLSINTFLERNDIYGKDIVNVLREANDVINLNKIISNLKTEIEKLEQMKKKYSFQLLPPLQPLPKYPSPWNSYYY